ncbi:hypothetical protein ACHAWF_012537 [Thalassiosira exigua]
MQWATSARAVLLECYFIWIGCYLNAMLGKEGLIMNQAGSVLKINKYPDADFAGTYGYEQNNDPTRVKS